MWQKIERRLLPELDRFPSREAANKALETAKKRRAKLWVVLLGILIAVCCSAGVYWAAFALLNQRVIRRIVAHFATVFLIQSLTAYIGLRLFVTPLRKSLRRSLQAKGIPICIPCGYDLRGQTETRCPECGAAFDAHLVSQIITDEQPS